MTATEFGECLDKLRDVFGKTHYPELRAKALWAGLQHFPNGLMWRATEKLLLTARSAPLYVEIKDAIEAELRNQPRPVSNDFTRSHDCDHCGANGVIEMVGYLHDRRTTAFAACEHCEQGRRNAQGNVTPSVSKLKARGWEILRPRAVFDQRGAT